MGKKTIIFNQLIEVIDRENFNDLVEKHGADRYVKNYDVWSHFLALIYSQLTKQESLRSLEMNFGHSISKSKINNVAKPKRSTFSDANKRRPPEFFQSVCFALINKLKRIGTKGSEANEALRLIDSTPIQLGGRGMDWVKETQRIKGLKAHFVYDAEDSIPMYFAITCAKVNDIKEAQKIDLQENQAYVFDRAYYDFDWWNKINNIGSTFVTRPKNTLAYKVTERRTSNCKNIKHDHTIRLTSKKAYKYKGALREIKASIEVRGKNKTISILTNNFNHPAEKIVAMYKKRWDIELFFKWIKQNLKIKKFYSENENAIKIQIITAVITYLLVKFMLIRSRTNISLKRLIVFLENHLLSRVKYKYGSLTVKISLPRQVATAQVGLT